MGSVTWIPPEVVSGTTTSWIPLTTAYPSLSGCAEAFFEYPGQPPVAWDPGYGYWAGAQLFCLPAAATTWWEQEHQNPDGFTSLSIQPIVCPDAFTTAATEIKSIISTQVKCCPSHYTLIGGQPDRLVGDCFSSLSLGQVFTYTAQNEAGFYVQSTSTIEYATSIKAIPVHGWNVARTETPNTSASPPSPDAGSTSTGSATAGSTSTGSTMTGSTMTGSATTDSALTGPAFRGSVTTGSATTGSTTTDLTTTGSAATGSAATGSAATGSAATGSTTTASSNWKIGLGVGIAAALAVLVLVGFFIIRRRRQRRFTQSAAIYEADKPVSQPEKDSKPVYEIYSTKAPLSQPEKDSNPVHEMYSTEGPAELATDYRR